MLKSFTFAKTIQNILINIQTNKVKSIEQNIIMNLDTKHFIIIVSVKHFNYSTFLIPYLECKNRGHLDMSVYAMSRFLETVCSGCILTDQHRYITRWTS